MNDPFWKIYGVVSPPPHKSAHRWQIIFATLTVFDFFVSSPEFREKFGEPGPQSLSMYADLSGLVCEPIT